MAEKLPVVCIFGVQNIDLESAGPVPAFETRKLDCRCYLTDDDLDAILARDRPSVVVSFGGQADFPKLLAAPFELRQRWVAFPNTDELTRSGSGAFFCYLHSALTKRTDIPLVTVFTPAYKTGSKIMRPLDSLLAQTYRDWEWIIVDDSDDDGETWEMLKGLTERDYRIRVYREARHSGVIGHVKRCACMLGLGEYLVELDHDDELTPFALEKIVGAFKKYPEAGFVYTDFAECFEDGSPATYPDGWGFGYGSYREEAHNGQKYMVVNSPNINPKTIRHIVAAPNHARCWRKSTYVEIGGHADMVHVADDYELMVRTFLRTRMARIRDFSYVQYRNAEGNTHRERNREIQRLVRYFSNWYDKRIHDRFVQLGVDDSIYQEGESSFDKLLTFPKPQVESHATILLD